MSVLGGMSAAIQAIQGSNGNSGLVSVALGTTGVQLAQQLQNSSQTTLYNQNNGLFTEYALTTYYRTLKNILQMPNATPQGGPPLASIVKWANDTVIAVVEWSATGPTNPVSGSWPLIPASDIGDPNMFLIEAIVIPESPTTRADGSDPQYRVSGKYTYALADPTKLVLRTGQMPWITDNGLIVTTIPASAFNGQILVPGSTQGTTGNITIQPA